MDGAGFEPNAGARRAQPEVAQTSAVAGKNEHGDFLRRRDAGGDIGQGLGGSGNLVGGGDDNQSVAAAALGAAQASPGLFGIALDEGAGGGDDRFAVAEGARELAALDESEMVAAAAHQRNIAAGEAVDGLPVVADKEVSDAGAVERPEQGEASGGDVLELVDEHVAKRGGPLPEASGFGGVVDQVVEVERVFSAEQLLVAVPDAFEEIKEGGAAHDIGELVGAGSQLLHSQAGGLDQAEERGEQLSKPGGDHAAQVAEQALDGRPLQSHAAVAETALQRGQQRVIALLPAVGLDQRAAVLLVQVAFPEDAFAVFRPA